ncbi:Uncharacterised protein [Vibrio cholerae]|nr:Uncharacterised protein [Vibrio cholerae]
MDRQGDVRAKSVTSLGFIASCWFNQPQASSTFCPTNCAVCCW